MAANNTRHRTMAEDPAVVQRVEELLEELQLQLPQETKELIRKVARGEASKEITFSYNSICIDSARVLSEALKNSPHVTVFDVKCGVIGYYGATFIAEGLKHVPDLLQLTIQNSLLGPEGGRAIAEGLKNVPNLQQLNLDSNDLGPEGGRALAEGLKQVPNLQILSLWVNGLGPEGACAIAKALKHVPNLRHLNLAKNELAVQSGLALAEGLKHVPKLETLNIDSNKIGFDGARALAEGLKHVPKLRLLHLAFSGIGTEGARAIGAVLSRDREVDVKFHFGDNTGTEEFRAFDSARPAAAAMQQAGNGDNSGHDESSLGGVTMQWLQQELTSKETNIKQLDQQLKEGKAKLKEEKAKLKEEKAKVKALKKTQKQQAQQLKKEKATVKSLQKKQQKQAERLDQMEDEVLFFAEQNQEQADEQDAHEAEIADLEQQMDEQNDALAGLKATNETLEERIRQLEQRLDQADPVSDLIIIPRSRFSTLEIARDHKGKVIKGSLCTLYTAKLGGHRVALKQLDNVSKRPRVIEILQTPEAVVDADERRLYRAAHVLLSIRHPNIVACLGLSHDEENKTLSFVLSWAEGGSLYDHLHVHKRPLTKVQRARIAMEVAGAMQFLHAHGIVHRDLKSPNVLLDGSLSAKVTDFGLSAFKQGDDETLTQQMRTLLWASPEQLLDQRLYADTDVFSFGVLYWELCFNCKPWHHDNCNRGKGASVVVMMAIACKDRRYLPVDGEINGVVLSAAQKLLLGGCFDVLGNRLDFTQLHAMLRTMHQAVLEMKELKEKQLMETLLGAKDAVWKFPPPLLDAVKAVAKPLASRPSVSIAPLDLKRDAAVIKKLLADAGGAIAKRRSLFKPLGKKLAAVAITHDTQKEAAFNGALAHNKTRYRGHLTSGSSHPFSPKYDHSTSTKEPTNEEEKQVLRRVTCGTTYKLLDPSLLQDDPPLRLQRVFSGVTTWEMVEDILGGDYTQLEQFDTYGAGLYFAPDLDYVLTWLREFWDTLSMSTATSATPAVQNLGLDASKQYRVVLACDIQYGNPYPVLDAESFKGKPLMSGHDAHVAVVDFTSGGVFDAKPFKSHKEWTQGYKRPVAEIAMNDPSCVLVRAVLVFEA